MCLTSDVKRAGVQKSPVSSLNVMEVKYISFYHAHSSEHLTEVRASRQGSSPVTSSTEAY
ncbi:hypothetical protein I79_006987 [Cricetulus griseus]|uniref:Uncharacterized protein n=1 Tax=Cricetulus griseus TaxID=10029 RepID=G3H9C0_CRIGR|nr:hypothetical protein I79_006987 [Cricetulus griseus]